MFKSARWRSEKNKFKAQFKLQLQATQVPQLGWETLMVSLVPFDVGKPTVKLEKAAVKDGTCRWENPIYETMKFVREPKTGEINQKIYQFLVSTGSSKAGLLGEVSIDFADYAEAVKPSLVSLPLKTGAVLHVTIQRMDGTGDQREVEENGKVTVKSQDRSLRRHLSNFDTDEGSNRNSTEDGTLNKPTSQITESNGNLKATIGSDSTSMSGSESSSERNTPRELGLKSSNTNEDPTNFVSSLRHSSMPRMLTFNAATTNYHEHRRSNTEWSVSSAPDGSLDGSTSSEDTILKERSSEASDGSIEKLKNDLVVLSRQAEVSELELQTLRKQIMKESKRGQELSREVVSLKEERDEFQRECEQLKALQKHFDEAKASSKLQFEGEDPRALLEEIRQELNFEKNLNANLRLQLQKTQESNSELMLAVQDLDEMLEQKNWEISHLSNKSATNENAEEVQETISRYEMDEDEDQQALDLLVKEHNDARKTYLLEQKIIDLYSEIEVYRRDRDELDMQMEQLALDYEILKQENHDISSKLEQRQLQEQIKMLYECSASLATINELETQIEILEKELKKQAQEFSTSLATINELKTQINSLEEELEKQAQGFEADLEAVTHAKIEQEQRAIRAEEALRKTRCNNAKTAERLQEECKRLFIQISSIFDANEKLAMKALTEASELRLQKGNLEEMLDKVNEELELIRDQYEAKLLEISNQTDMKTKQAEQMLLELEGKSTELEHQKKHEEERLDAFKREILMLRAEIDMVTREKNNITKQAEHTEKLRAEMEQMKTSIVKTEMLVQKGNAERDELEGRIASLTKDAEKSLGELSNMRCLKDKKEAMVALFEDELEKENLSKQIFHLMDDLRKKEEAINITEKKLQDNSGEVTLSDGTKSTSRNNKSTSVCHGSMEVSSLWEKIKLLEEQIELKEAALENSTNSYLEKEKDLGNKIEELENRIEELSQNSTSFYHKNFQEELHDAETINANFSKSEGRNFAENLLGSKMSTKLYMSDQNNIEKSIKRNNGTCSEKELKVSTAHENDQKNHDELLSEMALLKERSKAMEGELKEMQERYSEISLKFAEVEGERQQLVMAVRNLRNAKKN